VNELAQPFPGVYQEVVEPERLVVAEGGRDNWHEGAVTTVTFTDLGGSRTETVFRATIETTDALGRAAEDGTASSFERLAEILGSR
jgi:uncharacterized protein YndB with AHSA1/START domain